jgi:hypothetical protein
VMAGWVFVGTLRNPGDIQGQLLDSITFRTGISLADINALQSENLARKVNITYAEVNPTTSEILKLKVSLSNLTETNPNQSDNRNSVTQTFITSHTTSGTAPTNPTNSYGAKNDTLATIKGKGGASPTSSTLIGTVPVANVPAGGAKVLRVWFQIALSTGDSGSISYTNTGGIPASGTIASTSINNLATPAQVNLTSVGTSFKITATHTGAFVSGAGVTLDAACIETVGL